jgi:HEAT repeat protein
MVFGLFSKEKALQKTIEKATNKLAQQPDRWGALEKLKDDGTEDALVGLCRRFSITSMKGVEDEAEKLWVVDTLVAKGNEALAPVVRYMKTAEQLAFPLRVLERIAPREKVIEVADQLFASEPPGYVRMPERRIDLLRWFSEWKPATDDEVVSRFTPYVTDFDENVRFTAIEGLAHRDPAKIAPPLIAALLRPEEESGRIRRTIVEVLENSQAPLGAQAAAVGAVLAGPLGDDFKIEAGVLKKR